MFTFLSRIFSRASKKIKGSYSAPRYLTFFVLSNDTSRPRRLKLSLTAAKVLGACSVLSFLVLAFVVYDYTKIKANSREFFRLKKENAQQKIEIQDFSSKIRGLESQVARLDLFDKKLRIIANIEGPKKPAVTGQVKGIGGGSSMDVEDYLLTPGSKVDELVGQMRSDLTQLKLKADSQESRFAELQGQLLKKSGILAATPSIWPVRGWVTSTYGKRVSPFTGLTQNHRGIDIANRKGTPVVSTARGTVVRIARDANVGKFLVIRHGYGIKTIYGHLSKVNVRVGEKVKRRQKIASLGNTGRSTGSHLHYGVSVNGVFVNPTKYILN
ncbi:MAG: M23 family metallopeptidase [Thermodesulfobacteriota bacterium]